MEDIISYKYQEYPPTKETIGDLNVPNKDVIFDIDVGDGFMHSCNADVYMKYKLVEKSGTEYNEDAEVRAVDNFFAHMWSEMLVEKGDTIIDRIEYPGITSTALGTCLLSKSQLYKYKMSGWVVLHFEGKDSTGNLKKSKSTKEIIFRLKLLGGFFSGYKDVMYKGRLKITFKRNNSDDMAMHVWGAGKPGKIEIKEMYIRIPVIKYEPAVEVKLKADLVKQPVSINFIKSKTVKSLISGNNCQIDLTNSCEFDMPEWVIFLFQTDRNNINQKNYSAKFDHCKLKNAYFENGRGETFSSGLKNLKISDNEYLKMYYAYTELKRNVCNSDDVFYTFEEFIEQRPMGVIDISKHIRGVDDGGTSKKLVLDFENDVPAKTLCYIIMLGSNTFKYDIKNQRVIEHI